MLIHWFIRQRRRDKLAVGLFVLAVIPVLWTALASFFLVLLMGAGGRQYYPLDDPDTYWQWWAFFAVDQPIRMQRFLMISGVGASVPIGALIVRQVLDYLGGTKRPSLYGKSDWATPDDMRRGGLKLLDRL